MHAWDQFLAQLEKEMDPRAIQTWVRSLKVLRFDAANLYLEARDPMQANWFEEHIRPRSKHRFFNNNGRPIRIHLSLPSSTKKREEVFPRLFSLTSDALDPEMTFAHFVKTEANAMALQVLSEATCNPIFLFGPKGSGKTHLLMASAQELQKKGKKVFYVRAETFTEHVVQAIRLGQMRAFRSVYREIDALCMDDIHILARKIATQEEFFHTFNALHMAGKPILLSATVPPSQLTEIEPRLISRFEWGISLGLEKADPKILLEKKSALWHIPLTEELTHFLLETFPKDPLLALRALSLRAQGKTVTSLLAKHLLTDLIEKEQKEALTPEKIIQTVAAHFSLPPEDLLGKSQTRECTFPRQVAMYLCRAKLQLPYQKIGRLFGRDHSTVMAGIRQVEQGEKGRELVRTLSFSL